MSTIGQQTKRLQQVNRQDYWLHTNSYQLVAGCLSFHLAPTALCAQPVTAAFFQALTHRFDKDRSQVHNMGGAGPAP